jgi:putative membrane protein
MGPGWSWLFMALLLAGLVLVVVVLVRALAGGIGGGIGGGAAGQQRARQILAERYARGEVGTEEYQARLRALESD